MAPPYGARADRVTGSNVGDHGRLKLAFSVFAARHTKALNITLLEESKLVSHPQFKYFRMANFTAHSITEAQRTTMLIHPTAGFPLRAKKKKKLNRVR